MEILYLLEKFRFPALNECMLIVTRLGEETVFLVMLLIVFWCVDKRKGYYLMAVGFIGTMANQFLKLLFRVPRPWVIDGNFTIVEKAREAASGYSFPSGHSQSAVGTFGAIAHVSENRWVKAVCVAAAVLVPVSRMYLGVHTPADVLAGTGMALVLVFALKEPVLRGGHGTMKLLIGVMLVMALGLLAYVELFPFPGDVDQENLASGLKNGYTMVGCMAGVAVSYLAERKFVKFDTKAVWWAQVLKAVLGLVLVLLIKEGLRAPLDALFGGHLAARAVRYFLIVAAACVGWPMTFRWFGKLGVKR